MPRTQRKGDTSRGRGRQKTRAADTKALRMVGVNLASCMHEYLLRICELGALEGALEEMDIPPSLKPLIEAMHHILAGGRAEVNILEQGDPDIVSDLNGRLARGIQESNEINRLAGYSIIHVCI